MVTLRSSSSFLFVIPFVVLAAACQGPKGDRGEPGGPGPITEPPQLLSIYPDSGSCRTIFTLDVKNLPSFPLLPWNTVVRFDGHEARVLSVSATQVRVTDSFLPVDVATPMSVSVEVANQESNSISIVAFPSGTAREDGLPKIFGTVSSLAADGTKLYVVDQARGLFLHDTTTDEITGLLANGGTKGQLLRVFTRPSDGAVFLVNLDDAGFYNLLRLYEDGFTETVLHRADDINSLTWDPLSGNLYLRVGGDITRLTVDGVDDGWAVSIAGLDSIAFANGALFGADRSAGKIVRIDAETKAVTDFALGLPGARALVAVGSDLFTLTDTIFVRRIDVTGAVSTWSNVNIGVDPHDTSSLVPSGTSSFFVGTHGSTRIMRLDGPASARIAASGLSFARAVAMDGSTIYATQGECWTDPTTLAKGGTVLALPAQGPARLVTRDACVLYGLYFRAPNLFFTDVTTQRVARVDLETGVTITIADSTSGLQFPYGITGDEEGNLYVTDSDSTGAFGAVTKIDKAGNVTRDFGVGTGSRSFAITFSGSTLFVADPVFGAVYRVPVGGGPWELATPQSIDYFVNNDGLEADGNGGVYFSSGGAIFLLDAAGRAGPVSLFGTDFNAGALERDAVTGDLVFGNSGNSAAAPIAAMMP